MSTLIASFFGRNRPLLMAFAMAAVVWSADALARVLLDEIALVTALFPSGLVLGKRLVIAGAIGGAAAIGCTIYNRSIRARMCELSDCDLQYQTILESTFDSIFTINATGAVVAANSAASRAFGGAATDLAGRHINELITEVVDKQLKDSPLLFSVIDAQDDWPHEMLQVFARGVDGRRFPAEVNVVPASFGDRKNRFVFVREISERVAAQAAIKRSEQKYRDLFESMDEGVYRCYADGTVIAANQAMVRKLGYSTEAEVIQNVNTLKICANHDQSQAIMDSLAEHGEAREIIVDIVRKDGSILTAATSTRIIDRDDDDEVVYQGTFTDISELRAATDALRDSEEHFRALTENAVDIVTVTNEGGEILYVSPSCLAITGFMPEQMVGQSVFASVHFNDQDMAKEAIANVFRSSGETSSFACRFLKADGEILQIETIGNAFRNSKGELRAVLNTRNITERRRTEQQLQQAQKMQAIGHLTGGIAHDFNNLLTVIVGNLQLIGERDLDSEASDQVDTAYRAAMQGADLTRRLLAFAKRQPLEPKVIDVSKLLHAMDSLLHRSLGKLMNIEMNLADDLWLAKVDPAQLESAILNLAINSRDAMDGEGLLQIRTKNCAYGASGLREDPVLIAGEYVCISVEDNGSGMTEEVRKAAVEPFFSTKQDKNGSGLGLSMVYGFVQQSGGHIRLDSREGEGTCIELYLPRSTELESNDAELTDAPDVSGGSETVLVVDDNADVRGAAAAILLNLGYDIVEADSGKQALEVLSRRPIDLLFSDIKMPKMSGLELAERVRQRNPDTQILLTSGYSDEAPSGDKARSFEFLRKPYSRQDLALRLRTILDE